MGLIKNSNNGEVERKAVTIEEKGKVLTAQQKSFACSYAKDIVNAMISQGIISDEQIEDNIKRFHELFVELL